MDMATKRMQAGIRLIFFNLIFPLIEFTHDLLTHSPEWMTDNKKTTKAGKRKFRCRGFFDKFADAS